MAETLANGTVVPQGPDLIHSNGVQAMRNLGASVDSQLGARSLTTHTHAWSAITGKPTNFSPSSHTHPASQITDLQSVLASALAPKANVEAVELGAGANANTLTTPGRYVETNAADAASIVNFPEQRAGILDVAANADRLHVWQLWRPYTGNRMFMRSRTGGTWTSWEQIVTGSDPRLTDARPPTTHTHTIGDVGGLQAALDARLAAIEYDSGLRNITAGIVDTPTSGGLYIRRQGNVITYSVDELLYESDDSLVDLGSIPVGFRPSGRDAEFASSRRSAADTNVGLRVRPTGNLYAYRVQSGRAFRGSTTWITTDPIPAPSTLPGGPA